MPRKPSMSGASPGSAVLHLPDAQFPTMPTMPGTSKPSGHWVSELASVPRSRAKHRSRPHLFGERFIPAIPLDWVQRAHSCGDRGIALACLIWFAHRVRKESPIRLTPSLLALLGIDTKTARRLLQRMADDGLIDVEFHRGRSPRVVILSGGDDSEGDVG